MNVSFLEKLGVSARHRHQTQRVARDHTHGRKRDVNEARMPPFPPSRSLRLGSRHRGSTGSPGATPPRCVCTQAPSGTTAAPLHTNARTKSEDQTESFNGTPTEPNPQVSHPTHCAYLTVSQAPHVRRARQFNSDACPPTQHACTSGRMASVAGAVRVCSSSIDSLTPGSWQRAPWPARCRTVVAAPSRR